MPDLTNVPAGAYTLERRVNSDFGCGNDVASQPFTVKPVPEVEPKLSMDHVSVFRHYTEGTK
jgi:hypothetical protein